MKVGMREARCPTRFGNIVAEYESYPNIRYGIEPTLFWYRLMFVIPKDVYSTLDDAGAAVECLVFTSAVLLAFAPFYLILSVITSTDLLTHVAGAMIALSLSYFVYRLSLFPLRIFGEYFKAVFDLYRKDLDASLSKLRPAPRSLEDEARFWKDIRNYLWYRQPLARANSPKTRESQNPSKQRLRMKAQRKKRA